MIPATLKFLIHTLAVLPVPTVADASVSPAVQWAAVCATARVGGGPEGGATAAAVCIGVRNREVFLLTAAHVVPEGQARVYEFFTKNSYPKPAQTLVGGTVIFRSGTADIALVKIPAGSDALPALRLAAPSQRPKRFPFGAVTVGCPQGFAPKCRVEKILGKRYVRRSANEAAFYWELSTPPVGGMSGGPLLDENGRVIGICSAAQAGRGYVSHLDEIQYLLKQNGYSWLYDGSGKP